MTSRIRILPEQLANKIAAGEVVERPSSVVKELLENALDAGATELTVEVEQGGKKLIRVSDNGSGMTREELLLSLERHATSKITSDADLFALTTLGFRGEALPSIASVSRLTLASRKQNALAGTEIYLEGGTVRTVTDCGMAEGTVVTVRNLFFNTPARLKFLRSTETEAGHLADVVVRMALSRPDVRFIYRSDGRTAFRLACETLFDRVATLMGKAVAQDCYPLQFAHGGLEVTGLASRPELSRSQASHIHTFLNGRFLRDRVVQHAIMAAYRSILEKGRYPVVILAISMPADEVDVNVHPTKHEVRFRNQPLVHDTIRNALEEMLRRTPWQHTRAEEPCLQVSSAAPLTRGTSAPFAPRHDAPSQPYSLLFSQIPLRTGEPVSLLDAVEKESDDGAVAAPSPAGEVSGYAGLRYLGQFAAAYLVCEDGDDLVLMDQHAAHERVAFERLRREFRSGGVESQGLLFPETIHLNHQEAAAVRSHLPDLQAMGFTLEEFGGTAVRLVSVPRLIQAGRGADILQSILAELVLFSRTTTIAEHLDDLLATIACHSVVRGVAPLTAEEVRALLREMDETDFSANCPHGRPVLVRITRRQIDRMFGRA